jgi:hypothetical protein
MKAADAPAARKAQGIIKINHHTEYEFENVLRISYVRIKIPIPATPKPSTLNRI